MSIHTLPIFVINLDDAVRRKDNMERRLRRYGLRFTRIEASTPATLRGNYVHYLSPTQRACTHSHIRILERIVAEDIPRALILEDDAIFRSDWVTITNEKLHQLDTTDPQWDALFLNVAEPYIELETWHIAKDQCLSGAYIINRHAAQWILDTFRNMYYCIDWMTQILQRRRHSYTYYPWLVIQEGTDTYNTSNVSADYAKVLRCLAESNYGLEHYDF